MNTGIREITFAIIFGLFSFANLVNAQITIDENDIDTSFGTTFTLFQTDNDSLPINVNLGTAGGPNTWQFDPADFPPGDSIPYNIIDPASTPWATDFPNADHVWNFVEPENNLNTYSFTEVSNNGYLHHSAVFQVGPNVFKVVFSTPRTLLTFPATLGTTWNDNYIIVPLFDPANSVVDSTSAVSTVDAWGTITTPLGTFNCLRVRVDEIEISLDYQNGVLVDSDTTTNINYLFYTENEGYFAEISSLDNETNPNFTIASDINFRMQNLTVGIEENSNLKLSTFDLAQNYPNPFNPSTQINYSLSKSNFVNLTVFNEIGQEVQVLKNGFQNAGNFNLSFDGSNLSSGTYFYKIKVGNQTETKKMLLIK